jgi:hypothetical protein
MKNRLADRAMRIAGMALAMLIAWQLFAAGPALAKKKKDPQIDFYADLSTLLCNPQPDCETGVGSFYVEGPVYPAGTLDGTQTSPPANPIGIARCWGWFPYQADPAFNVLTTDIVFTDGNSVETEGPAALDSARDMIDPIIGGTEKFRGVRGQMVLHLLEMNDSSAQFRLGFDFLSAPNKVP